MAAAPPEELQEETTGSDQVHPVICDHCFKDGRSIETNAFCSECSKYLCLECLQTHRRENVTHNILAGSTVPEKQSSKLHRKLTCSKHPDKVLESLCYDHKTSCCVACKRLDHGSCKTLIKLSDLPSRENANEENELKMKSLKRILDELERLEIVTEKSKLDLEEERKGTIDTIQKSRKEIDEKLDTLESDMITLVSREIDAKANDLEKQRHEVNGLKGDVKEKIAEFEGKKISGCDDQVIVTSTLLEFDIQKYNTVLTELHGSFYNFKTKFSLDNMLQDIIGYIREFGELEIVSSKVDIQRKYDDRQVVYLGERDISLSSDQREKILVPMMELLPDGRLLLCDKSNCQVDLFGSNNEIISSIGLTSAPCGMAVMSPKEIIICLPEKKCLQILKISKKNKLKSKEKFKTELPYGMFLKHEENLIACSVTNKMRYIDIISRHGRLISLLRKEPVSGRMVSNTHCCSDGSVIYIAGMKGGCIGISLNGEEIFRFTDETMTLYSGICTISDGCVCLTGYDSDNIVLLKNNGTSVTELVKLKGFKPTGITYSKENNVMLVKVAAKSVLKVFSLV